MFSRLPGDYRCPQPAGKAAAGSPTGRAAFDAAPPLLTAGHQCQHCGSPIETPTRRTKATVFCPSCDNKTSVYAVLHSCPACRRLLESPARSAGAGTNCPGCKETIRVPKDVLLEEPPAGAADTPGEFWFGFYCPGCGEEVATREKDVGAYAVCPHCRVPLVVPHWGHYLEGAGPAPPHDPFDSLHASREVPCPVCGARFPARAVACPMCGARTSLH